MGTGGLPRKEAALENVVELLLAVSQGRVKWQERCEEMWDQISKVRMLLFKPTSHSHISELQSIYPRPPRLGRSFPWNFVGVFVQIRHLRDRPHGFLPGEGFLERACDKHGEIRRGEVYKLDR